MNCSAYIVQVPPKARASMANGHVTFEAEGSAAISSRCCWQAISTARIQGSSGKTGVSVGRGQHDLVRRFLEITTLEICEFNCYLHRIGYGGKMCIPDPEERTCGVGSRNFRDRPGETAGWLMDF